MEKNWKEMSYNQHSISDRLTYESYDEIDDDYNEEFLYNVYCDCID